jgi:hypothetical protein
LKSKAGRGWLVSEQSGSILAEFADLEMAKSLWALDSKPIHFERLIEKIEDILGHVAPVRD